MLAFAWRVATAAEPLIPLAVLANPVVKTATVAAGLAMGALMGLSIFMPIYFETVLGLSASQSGLALIPLSIGTVIGSTIAGRLMVNLEHYKRPPLIGPDDGARDAARAWRGTRRTCRCRCSKRRSLRRVSASARLFPPSTVAIQNAVARHDLGTATAVSNFFRQIGGALIVAIFGALVFGATGHGAGEASHSLAGVEPARLASGLFARVSRSGALRRRGVAVLCRDAGASAARIGRTCGCGATGAYAGE